MTGGWGGGTSLMNRATPMRTDINRQPHKSKHIPPTALNTHTHAHTVTPRPPLGQRTKEKTNVILKETSVQVRLLKGTVKMT